MLGEATHLSAFICSSHDLASDEMVTREWGVEKQNQLEKIGESLHDFSERSFTNLQTL
jgi:hypothetical protein